MIMDITIKEYIYGYKDYKRYYMVFLKASSDNGMDVFLCCLERSKSKNLNIFFAFFFTSTCNIPHYLIFKQLNSGL